MAKSAKSTLYFPELITLKLRCHTLLKINVLSKDYKSLTHIALRWQIQNY